MALVNVAGHKGLGFEASPRAKPERELRVVCRDAPRSTEVINGVSSAVRLFPFHPTRIQTYQGSALRWPREFPPRLWLRLRDQAPKTTLVRRMERKDRNPTQHNNYCSRERKRLKPCGVSARSRGPEARTQG